MEVRAKPIGTPLPRITGNRIDSKPIRRERIYRASPGIAIFSSIVIWELALPDIAAMFSVRPQLIAPRIEFLLQASARGIFPLGFCRQTLSRPLRKRDRIAPGNMNYRMILTSQQIRPRPFRSIPLGAAYFAPPWGYLNSILHHLAEFFPRNMQPEDKGPAKTLRVGAISRRFDELTENLVGYGAMID